MFLVGMFFSLPSNPQGLPFSKCSQ